MLAFFLVYDVDTTSASDQLIEVSFIKKAFAGPLVTYNSPEQPTTTITYQDGSSDTVLMSFPDFQQYAYASKIAYTYDTATIPA